MACVYSLCAFLHMFVLTTCVSSLNVYIDMFRNCFFLVCVFKSGFFRTTRQTRSKKKRMGSVRRDEECFKKCADLNPRQAEIGVMGVEIRGRSCSCVAWAAKLRVFPSRYYKTCLLKKDSVMSGKCITMKRNKLRNYHRMLCLFLIKMGEIQRFLAMKNLRKMR